MESGSASLCDHARLERLAPLYENGCPLYRCLDCDARGVLEDDEPSDKGIVPLRRRDDSA